MSAPRYSPTQLLQTATITYRNASDVTEALATQFPASNVADTRAGTVAKFPRLELGSIVANFGTNTAFNCVGFLNHNLAADAQLSVQKSSNGTSWTDITTGISLTSARYWVTFASQTDIWVRMTLTALGGQVAAPYFGEVWVGTLVTLTRNHAFGVRTGRVFNNATTRTAWGIPNRYHKNAYSRVTGTMADALSLSERNELEALLEAIKGSSAPFLFVPDGAVATECWIAEYMADEWETAQTAVGQFDGFALNVREIPWGKPV